VKRSTWTMLVAVGLMCASTQVGIADEEGWISLFDGKTLSGWKKAEENQDAWKVADGTLMCDGSRCHLFYVGDAQPFKNFEFEAEVKTAPGSNSGIYIHTAYQAEGWPKQGYEVQVNNTHRDPVKTGSLYGVVKVLEAPAKDDEWFKMSIRVEGKQVTVKVDGKTLVEYTEPEGQQAGGDFARVLGEGTFALQAHDPQSKVYFRNLRVKKLP
jgi:hypothetical protein